MSERTVWRMPLLPLLPARPAGRPPLAYSLALPLRAGKWVEIDFDAGGRVAGASISTYLLERWAGILF